MGKRLLNPGRGPFIRNHGGDTDLLDHDGEGTKHLESSGKVHNIAPTQHQSKGHRHHLPVCVGEPHHHGHQHHEGISDTGGGGMGEQKSQVRPGDLTARVQLSVQPQHTPYTLQRGLQAKGKDGNGSSREMKVG